MTRTQRRRRRVPSALAVFVSTVAMSPMLWAHVDSAGVEAIAPQLAGAVAPATAPSAAPMPTSEATLPIAQLPTSEPQPGTSATTRLAAATQPSAPAPQAAAATANPGIRWEKSFAPVAEGKWTGHRLADGQPDIQGDWSNTIGNHDNFTDPQGGTPGDPVRRKRTLGARDERAPSRVSDPADGQVPFQPWARAKQQEFAAGLWNATQPEYIEPLARCAPAGVPKSFMWHGYEIRQFPGYVLFLFNSGTRIIHLDGKPHLPDHIKLWNGDSRGHWEGNTLVVDVTNNNSKARFSRTGEFASENLHVEERYTFDASGKRFNYVATLTDPTVYTRPFTVTIPMRRFVAGDPQDGWHYEVPLANHNGTQLVADHYERPCVENNGPFGQVVGSAQ